MKEGKINFYPKIFKCENCKEEFLLYVREEDLNKEFDLCEICFIESKGGRNI